MLLNILGEIIKEVKIAIIIPIKRGISFNPLNKTIIALKELIINCYCLKTGNGSFWGKIFMGLIKKLNASQTIKLISHKGNDSLMN